MLGIFRAREVAGSDPHTRERAHLSNLPQLDDGARDAPVVWTPVLFILSPSVPLRAVQVPVASVRESRDNYGHRSTEVARCLSEPD